MSGLASLLVHMHRSLAVQIADRKLRRMLRRAPASTLAALPEDTWARVTGTVRALDRRVLVAPLTGRPCAYYSILVEDLRDGLVIPLIEEHDATSFVLEQGGHHALVDPVHASFTVAFDDVQETTAAFDTNPRQRAMLERHSMIDRDWFHTSGLRFSEALIRIDELVTVLGSGTREPDPDAAPTGAYRESGPTRVRLTGSQRYPLVISDDPSVRT